MNLRLSRGWLPRPVLQRFTEVHMSLLHLHSKGPSVGDLQKRLNCSNPTRLPRLRTDQEYGVLTMARVMEFQFLKGLEVDGAAGAGTLPVVALVSPQCAIVT